jgi:uncharacterized protein with FMN-binding domain
MKSVFVIRTLAVLGLFAASGCGSIGGEGRAAGIDGRGGTYTPGIYTGRGRGKSGEVSVSVQVDAHRITAIEILDTGDDPFVGIPAMEALSETVLEENTADIDIISGATKSSLGFLQAVEDALLKAVSKP